MTNKQLKKKIEEILDSGTLMNEEKDNVRDLLHDLYKKYALSVLPKERSWNGGFNRAIKKTKKNIEK